MQIKFIFCVLQGHLKLRVLSSCIFTLPFDLIASYGGNIGSRRKALWEWKEHKLWNWGDWGLVLALGCPAWSSEELPQCLIFLLRKDGQSPTPCSHPIILQLRRSSAPSQESKWAKKLQPSRASPDNKPNSSRCCALWNICTHTHMWHTCYTHSQYTHHTHDT